MKCSYCGYSGLTSKNKFCSECGQKATHTDATSSLSERVLPCPRRLRKDGQIQFCGEPIKETQKFCSECGWSVDCRMFLPGARMCTGFKHGGEDCDNIVTPNNKFCSECGKPPDHELSIQPPVITKSVVDASPSMASSNSCFTDSNSSGTVQRNEHIVSEEEMNVDHSLSSGQNAHAEITETNIQREGQNKEEMSMDHSLPYGQNQQSMNAETNIQSNEQNKEEKNNEHLQASSQNQQAMNPEMNRKKDKKNKEEMNVDHPQKSGQNQQIVTIQSAENRNNNNTELLLDSHGDMDVSDSPQEGGQSDKGINQVVNSSEFVSPSNNGAVYTPVWSREGGGSVSQGGSQEKGASGDNSENPAWNVYIRPSISSDGDGSNLVPAPVQDTDGNLKPVVAGIRELNMRKRKSPEKEIPDDIVTIEISVEESDDGDDDDGGDDDDNDDDDDDENKDDKETDNDGPSSTKRKKHVKQRKKKKYDYQKKKGQLPSNKETSENANKKTEKQKYELKTNDKPPSQAPSKNFTSNNTRSNVDEENKTDEEKSKNSITNTTGPVPKSAGNVSDALPQSQVQNHEDKSKLEEKQDAKTRKNEQNIQQGEKGRQDKENKPNRDDKLQPEAGQSQSQVNNEKKEGKVMEKVTYAEAASRTREGVTTRASATIEVFFHVIVSDTFISSPNEDLVYLRFINNEFAGWNRLTYRLHPKEILPVYGILYEGVLQVPKKISHQNFYYNYCVVPKGLLEWTTNEYFYGDKKRALKIHSDSEIWHQYDGVSLPKPNKSYYNILGFFKSQDYENDVADFVKFAAQIFFPKWKGFFLGKEVQTMRAMEAIDTLDMILRGLWMNYGERMRRWSSDHRKFRKDIGQAYLNMLQPKLEQIVSGKEKDPVSALGILYVIDRFDIEIGQKEHSSLLKTFLFEVDTKTKDVSKYKEILEQYDAKFLQNLVEKLIDNCKDNGNAMLFCLVPLWHFLTKRVHPYEKAQLSCKHDASEPVWWGINGMLDGVTRSLKRQRSWGTYNAKEILNILVPLIPMDYMLPRSFVAALKYEQFGEVIEGDNIPSEVIIAGICYYTRTLNYVEEKNEITTKCFKHLLQMMRKKGQDEYEISEEELNHAWMTYNISSDLVESVLKHVSYKKALCLKTFELFAVSLSMYDNMFQKRGPGEGKKTQHKNLDGLLNTLHRQREVIISWMKKLPFLTETKIFLKAWNHMLGLDLFDGTVKTAFMGDLKDAFREDIGGRTGTEKLVDIYCSDIDEYAKPMQDVLSEVAFQALEKGCRLDDSILRSKGVGRYGHLLSRLFEGTWNKTSSEGKKSFLELTLSWPSFFHFLKMFYHQEEQSKHLSEDCKGLLVHAAGIVKQALDELLIGTITVEDFNLIQKNEESFMKIIKIVWERDHKSDENLNEHVVLMSIKIREEEITQFKNVKADLGILADMCQHFDVNLESYDSALSKFSNIEKHRISHFCHPALPQKIQNIETYVPVVCAFEIDPAVLDEIPRMKKCWRGTLFVKLWGKQGKRCVEEKGEQLTIDEVMENVWTIAYADWKRICDKIFRGTIRFREFERHFGRLQDDKILKRELGNLSEDEDNSWIDERLTQIKQHRTIQKCVEGASVILTVVDTYGLEGEFQPIRLIIEMTGDADIEMCKLDKSLIRACDCLKEMTQEQARCIQTFNECQNLVLWLRESMKNLQELKVFVDLASISAGEGDMEVGKVKCLHAATTGYAPLIFNLDKSCDYIKFLEQCKLVWKELAADPLLPEKLRDTNRHQEWLNSVKSAQGSVEVTSMRQAEAINSDGIYIVGKIKQQHEQADKKKLELEDVLELHVKEDDKLSRLRKVYRFKELQELQSKLMLVAGKAEMGKDDVDRFTMVLDSVVRLCNVYIKLVSSGCVLFTNWQAKFLCDPRKVCAFVRFGSGEGCTELKGRRTEHEDVSTVIPRLARFMEHCLEKWLEYIDSKRDEYSPLNFYTIDQMVILQRELVLVGGDSEPSDLIYPLLSIIKHDCTKPDLINALKKAKADVTRREAEQEVEMIEEEEEVDSDDENQTKANNKFIVAIIDAGYTETLARRALNAGIDPLDVDEGVVWCMDHEDDKEITSAIAMDTRNLEEAEGVVFEGWTDTSMSISAMTENILSSIQRDESAKDTLIPELEKLWSEFLSSISSSVSDYLSVEHLGLILRRLSETETFAVKRELLPCFESGVPNLLLCPQDEILNTVLSIYSPDKDEPLPQPDEVLLCTPHTTLDEIEIFWRRSIYDCSGRIHCLVNADVLDYEVSDKGERRLDYHMQRVKEREILFRLVVVCSTEKEYHSRIVAALDKYRRPPLPSMTHGAICQYIKTKLTVDTRRPAIKPSADVDFENCTVRVVKSWRAGVGKSLYKRRLSEKLQELHSGIKRQMKAVVSIPLHEREINIDDIMAVLLENTLHAGKVEPRLFHIDLSHEVQEGVDYLLFQLLILGCLTDSSGNVWRKLPFDLYIIETMPLLARDYQDHGGYVKCLHRCLDILPDVICRSPKESLDKYLGKPTDFGQHDLLFDDKEFRNPVFQRPFQYLFRLDTGRGLADVNLGRIEGNPQTCLQTLLRHCGIMDPSWAELRHFVWFLNTQLKDFEGSAFCGLAAAEDLPGFSQFVLKFLINMSRDFATRSLNMSEESPIQMLQRMETDQEEEEENPLLRFQLRRTWESSPHPYLFFNPDHHSLTFLGFNIDRQSGNLLDQQTGAVLERAIMPRNLQDALKRNRVSLDENFDNLQRDLKLTKLCSVMGLELVHDPDSTYELTTDNVKKILAIYMRFRCDIPVMIMGETGCGKTRLIKFMCSLQCPIGVEVQNMILMKVHGGTRRRDIINKVHEAEMIAQQNTANYGSEMYTVLFFDEANTTEAIGLIKEIMCDRSMGGEPLQLCQSLKIVAACNPYRKHSEELIKRLEQAGLGYHVDADKTTDRMGRVPMRRLVYRVQPLPQSMLPLVWDFGQLNTQVEEMYIKQMVLRYTRGGQLPNVDNLETTVSRILTAAQDFMRRQKDECSFVSLRDVERVLEVMTWFFQQSQGEINLFTLMDRNEANDEDSDDEMEDMDQPVSDLTKSLILALGVCYHACLKDRLSFRQEICQYFTEPCVLPRGDSQMLDIIERCQKVFLKDINLGKNIAKNQALKENVFMMVICIELRIPLFLVGKPGSSKSLAKTIVADAMQGNAALAALFRHYKQVQMVSFQCSPLSVPEGIVGTFRQCAMYQKDKDLNRFVSVVVLDEVGLAEDSPRMPLKTLHPLLEDGCQGDEKPEAHKKVAFIGISNWALDPAKMNRGILVQREVPDLVELNESAKGICSGDINIQKKIQPLIKPLAESYLQVFEAVVSRREFYGLRDFYSLVKMVYGFAAVNHKKPTWLMLKHCIKRNFGGFEEFSGEDRMKTAEAIFAGNLKTVEKIEKSLPGDPDCSPAGLIQACLQGDNNTDSDTRYLLLLTENYGALSVLQQKIQSMENAITIFGSSFPSDQEYTQVCRNINRIKVCMETGSTVVLLNLENLYESLYDALNQYYVYFGGERYVDLGLGTHRVKCRVHKNFRLIVVAEKNVVYNKFPIPLINRLEKHFLNISTMLSPAQVTLADKLEKWARKFIKTSTPMHMRFQREKKADLQIGDVFMGFHADTCASIILHVCQQQRCNDEALEVIQHEVLASAEEVLLWCATPDAVVRLKSSQFTQEEFCRIENIYFQQQNHESLLHYLDQKLRENNEGLFAQVTTHSKLITTVDVAELSRFLNIPQSQITLLTLQSFDTEQQFCRQIKQSFEQDLESESLLIVQCDSGTENASLVACARYCVLDQLNQLSEQRTGLTHIVFIIHLPRVAGQVFTGFQCGLWHSVHIDDLRPDDKDMPGIMDMRDKSVGTLLERGVTKHKPETEEMEWENGYSQEKVGIPEESGMEVEQDIYDNDFLIETRNTGQVPVNKCINIPVFIKLSAHSALAMVRDPENQSERSTERVKILLKLFNEESQGKLSFMSGLSVHLASMIKEKEQNSGHTASNWLSEATNREYINKAGTFRKASRQCLIEKFSPILAGIISQIDTNRNLDILSQNPPDSWKHVMWLHIINSPAATQIEYSMLVSPTRQQELLEVTVKGTGCDGRVFSAEMPFSWLIHSLMERALRTSQEVDKYENSKEQVDRVAQVVLGTALGHILQQSIGPSSMRECVMSYVSDFVHIVYPVSCDEEHRLVCENLMNGSTKEFQEELKSIVHILVGVHVVHNKALPRLRNFMSITRVWPQCSATVVEFQQTSAQFYLVTDQELTLDVLGLYLLLRELEPAKDALNEINGRRRWQQNVNKYRPVIERILGEFTGSDVTEELGKRCQEGITSARQQWTRITVMKLFLQHVCSDKDFNVKRCMSLWVILKGVDDFKKLNSLEKLEKFLKMCMKDAVKSAFGEQEQCKSCESDITERPIRLPCKDVICIRCYNDIKILRTTECPVCHQEIPDKHDPENDNTQNIKIQKYKNFKKSCNSFFMDVVSQLCFTDDKSPSKEVIERLMTYITTQPTKGRGRLVSKEMSIFEEGIDPTPILRSFLLQHLIRTSSSEVEEYLEVYLQSAKTLLNEDDDKMVELCLLVIQCLEDSYHQDISRNLNPEKTEIKSAKEMLEQNVRRTITEEISVQKLNCLAQIRFGLIVTSKYLHKVFVEKSMKINPPIRRLLDAAGRLCQESGTKSPKLFLIKHLCRCYGVESYQKLCKSEDQAVTTVVRWLTLPELNNDKILECSDRFIVCGERYKNLREKLTQSVLGQNMEMFQTALEETAGPDHHKRTLVLLALYREITLSHLYPESKRRVSPQAIEAVQEFLVQHDLFSNQRNFPGSICRNEIWHRNQVMTITEGMNLGQQNTACLLNHFFIMILQIPSDRTLLEPLNKLIQQPQEMVRAFIPTMPQDDVAEIKEALLAARQGGNENPVFYRCPNGHPYVIGNCGRPNSRGRCKECGEEIGGEGHKLIPTNKLDDGLDQTATGHILGRAENRVEVASPERNMSPVICAIVRLFTHMSMYLGANVNPRAIEEMIKPNVVQVLPFLYNHIQKDLVTIQRSLGRSVDDVYILVHRICHIMMTRHRDDIGREMSTLSTKASRGRWEDQFAHQFLEPALQDSEDYLKHVNREIASDQRLGSDPLLCLLFEINPSTEQVTLSTLHNNPAVWRYRTQITVDHLYNTFATQTRRQFHVILHMFLQEEHYLRSIRLIPNILKLQKILIQRYQRKLDRAEASAMSIEEMIHTFENGDDQKRVEKEGRSDEIRELVDEFMEAWSCVKEQLLTFTCPTMEGLAKVSKEYCNHLITERDPVSKLLPTFRDAGLCAYALVYFLLKKQNDFLQEYCKKRNQQFSSLPRVNLSDVTTAHLISYHPDRDLLPMVQANCHYTFEVGKGTKIEYNFGDIEHQLMDRFLFSKSVIEMPVYEFEMMTYRAETTNAVVFKNLREKIKQEPLTPAVASQICEEFRSYPELCESLDKLDITISFLKSVGGEQDIHLEKFMTQTLKMENPFPSQKARSACLCKHAQSLWVTLAMEKTKRQASHKQDAFEGIVDEFREELLDEQRELISAFCEDLPPERLNVLIETLFECIMLTITVPRGTDDDDDLDMTKLSLQDTLIGYTDAPPYETNQQFPDWMTDLIAKMQNEDVNRSKIQNSQAVDFWLYVFAIYTQKQTEGR